MTEELQPSTSPRVLVNKYWLDVPVRAVIYPTNRCNYVCNHCYASDFSRPEISLKEYSEIFKKLSDWGVLEVVFLGGEPLVREDFLDIAESAQKLELGTKVSTNGSMINVGNSSRIHDLFSGKMQVSLDASIEKTNDSIRGKNSFARTMNGIDALLSRGTEFSLGTVVTKINYNQLPEIYQFAKEKGIKGMHVMRAMPKGRALVNWDEIGIKNDEWVNAINSLRDAAKEGYPKLQIDGTYEYENSTPSLGKCMSGCEAGRYEITLLSDGTAVSCDMFSDKIIGNVMQIDLNKEWLNNPLFNMFRQSKGSLKGKCESCEIDFCVGCRYQSFVINGGFHEEDPFCVRKELSNHE